MAIPCVLCMLLYTQYYEHRVQSVPFNSKQVQASSPLHSVQTGCGTHPTPYMMGSGGSFPARKVAAACSLPLNSI
jgi:hypothetical protein